MQLENIFWGEGARIVSEVQTLIIYISKWNMIKKN